MTEKDIRSLEWFSKSPAGFDCYYDSINDVTYKIRNTKVVKYFERREGCCKGSKYPAAFEQECLIKLKGDNNEDI